MKNILLGLMLLSSISSFAKNQVCGEERRTDKSALESLNVEVKSFGYQLDILNNYDGLGVYFIEGKASIEVRQMHQGSKSGGFSKPYTVEIDVLSACIDI